MSTADEMRVTEFSITIEIDPGEVPWTIEDGEALASVGGYYTLMSERLGTTVKIAAPTVSEAVAAAEKTVMGVLDGRGTVSHIEVDLIPDDGATSDVEDR
jgi:hypothetical protein